MAAPRRPEPMTLALHAGALVPAVVLVAVPLGVRPAAGVWALGALAALLCAGGIATAARTLVVAGAAVALLEYASALAVSTDAPSPLAAVAIGVALALLLDVAELLRRFRGARLTGRALRAQARHWLSTAALGALAAVALAAVPGRVQVSGPPVLIAALTALAALGALAGMAGAARRSSAGDEPPTG
jgi:hypothetical protein